MGPKGRRWLNGPGHIKKHCVIFGCGQKTYALWLCRNHYAKALLGGVISPDFEMKCHVPGCENKFYSQLNKHGHVETKLCKRHRIRAKNFSKCGRTVTMEALASPKHWFQTGEHNWQWKGGKWPYRNYREYQKNRAIILKRDDYRCVKCKKACHTARRIDGDPENAKIENLQVMCHGCITRHSAALRGGKNSSKFMRMYGMTLMEMQDKFNTRYWTIRKWLNKGWTPNQPPPPSAPQRSTMSKYRKQFGMSLKEICDKYDLAPQTAIDRIRSGWRPGQENQPIATDDKVVAMACFIGNHKTCTKKECACPCHLDASDCGVKQNGYKYNVLKFVADAYDVGPGTIKGWIKRGWCPGQPARRSRKWHRVSVSTN